MSSPTNNSTKIEDSDASGAEISSSASYDSLNGDEHDKRTSRDRASIALPANVAGSGALDRLIDTARGYAEASTAGNTNKAYAADWKHFSRWCRLKGTEPLPPAPEMIGLYVADLAAPTGKAPTLSVSTIERRLSGLAWNYRQRGFTIDRKDRHIATVLAGIKRKHACPPVQKEAILPEDIQAMVATLSYDLRGLRDRAILLLGYAGGLRRSEVVCLDVHKDDTPDSGGWVEVFDGGALLTLNAKTGWREVEVGRGSSGQTCPVHALEQWLHFAKIDFGPVFVRTSRDGKRALESRLSDKHIARLIKATVMKSGIRSDLPEAKRLAMFSGHSLRAGLASSAEVDERYLYSARGQAENHIKGWKSHLASDRTSCMRVGANQMRLMLHGSAYWLWWRLRAACPKRSQWRHAQFDTLRLHLVKLAATIVEKKTRIVITLPASCPRQNLITLLFAALAPPKTA